MTSFKSLNRAIWLAAGLVAPVVLFQPSAPLKGQTTVGKILGKVIDPSGAPVPNCKVEAVNTGTKISQIVQTDELGLYVFPSLPAGTYDLHVERSGFRRSQESGVILDPISERVIDFKLTLGETAESVTVSAAVQQVQTTSGDVGSVVDNVQLSQIPLIGRNYSQLLWLVPGSVATPVSTTGSATTNAVPNPFGLNLTALGQRINGVRSQSTEFTLDGARNIDQGTAQNQMMNPSSEAIEEVKVSTASYSAEFGGRAGSSVSVVTKSGTQQFHGTLFEYVRNNYFDARSFFTSVNPPLHFNDFGWVIGGPVYVPGKWNIQKNKLFFFYSQEWKYDHEGTTYNDTVPTAAERQGNFQNSSLTAPVDPLNNNAPFANKIVPVSRFSKNGPLLLEPIPLPNSSLASNHTFIAVGENQTNPRQELARGDYYITPNMELTYRWTSDRYQFYDNFLNDNLGVPEGQRSRPGYITSISLSQTISPTAFNNINFSVDHNGIKATDLGDEIDRSTLGVTIPLIWPETGSRGFPAGQDPVPTVAISGFTGYGAGQRAQYGEAYFFVRDGFSKVAGAHTLKFGADIHHGNRQNDTYANDQGVVTFNTSATLTTKNAIADTLLGNFYTFQEDQMDTYVFDRWWEWDFYAQDSWRVSHNFTLELGLRYNLMPPYINAQGNNATFVPSRFNPAQEPTIVRSSGAIVANTGNPYNGIAILGSNWPSAAKGRLPQYNNAALNSLFVGLPLTGSNVNKNDWSPRIGIAYDPFGNGKTAIRAGFGIFYDRVGTDSRVDLATMPPFVSSVTVYNGNIDNPGGGSTNSFPSNLAMWPLHLPDPTVMTWNFGVQQQVFENTILDVAYVGTVGRHLFRTIDINQLPVGALDIPANSGANVNSLRPYPGYAEIDGRDNGDNSNYNSLQVKFSKRTRSGFSYGVNYTFSRLLDDTAGGVAQVTAGGSPQNNYNALADYGLSAFHRANALNFNYIYELPFFMTSPNKFLRKAVAGWEVAGVTTFRAGPRTA